LRYARWFGIPKAWLFEVLLYQTAMHFLTGTEVTDKHLPRQMSALATLAVLAQHAAKCTLVAFVGVHVVLEFLWFPFASFPAGTITDTKGHWATLEPWSKAVFDATTKAGGKVNSS
jgi:hypothetical protein